MQLSIAPRHSILIPRIPMVRFFVEDVTMLQLYSTFYDIIIDLIKPAVQGTLGILRSALKCIVSH